MIDRAGIRRDNKKIKFNKVYEGQEIVRRKTAYVLTEQNT